MIAPSIYQIVLVALRLLSLYSFNQGPRIFMQGDGTVNHSRFTLSVNPSRADVEAVQAAHAYNCWRFLLWYMNK